MEKEGEVDVGVVEVGKEGNEVVSEEENRGAETNGSKERRKLKLFTAATAVKVALIQAQSKHG